MSPAPEPQPIVLTTGHEIADTIGRAFAAGAHALPVPDTSFGTNGVALIRVLSGTEDQPTASALQSDGKLLVAGYNSGRYSHGFVLRLLAGGGLDTTFGQGGFVYMPPSLHD